MLVRPPSSTSCGPSTELAPGTSPNPQAFVALGMQPYESVNIWGFNAPEWAMSALAASFAGGKAAGIYPTDMPETAAYKVVHSSGSVIVVEDKAKIGRLVKALSDRKEPGVTARGPRGGATL